MIQLSVMKRTIKFVGPFLAAMSLCSVQTATPEVADAVSAPKSDPKPSDLFPDAVVAKGKDVEVKRSQLDDAMVSIKSTFAARGQDIPPAEMNRLEQQVLDRLIQIQILLHKATDAD